MMALFVNLHLQNSLLPKENKSSTTTKAHYEHYQCNHINHNYFNTVKNILVKVFVHISAKVKPPNITFSLTALDFRPGGPIGQATSHFRVLYGGLSCLEVKDSRQASRYEYL